MNKGTTIAFDNSGKVWKTRYSFVPTRYAYLDKKLLSCQGPNTGVIDGSLVWRHDEPTAEINKFYGEQFKSSLKTSFNKDLSANKLYKSLSIEGTTNLKGGENRFLGNSTSQKSNLRDAAVGKLNEKGGILYADLGRGVKNSNSNVGMIGVIRGVSRLFSSPENGLIHGYTYDPSLVKLDIDFLSSSFTSSSEFKILTRLDSLGQTSLGPGISDIGSASYDDLEVRFASPSNPDASPKGPNYLILKDLGYNEGGDLIGDFTGDGEVSSADLLELLGQFGNFDAAGSPFDLDGDGSVSVGDVLGFLQNFGDSGNFGEPSDGYLSALNAAIEQAQAEGKTLFAIIATPNKINGRDPKGQYADLFLDLGVDGSEDFELDVLNLNYEHTRLDHSS